VAQWIEAQGGEVVRGRMARSSKYRWRAPGHRLRYRTRREIKGLKRLDLSFTYVTDIGIERLQQLQQLEELNLDPRNSLPTQPHRICGRIAGCVS